MAPVEITEVSTRRQQIEFLNLPWSLYRDDPFWVPPLRMNQRELVNYKRHPFYDDAEIATFLAYRNGSPCGRIAAIHNRAHNRAHQDDQRGFVGFFESTNDQAVADGLFDAAKKWHAGRGLDQLRGPTNPSLNYECGLLVEPFDIPPTFMMTYNPRFYPQLWENYGFAKVQDLMSFVGHRNSLATMQEKIHFVAKEAQQRLNLQLRPISKRAFQQDVESFLDLYNSSLANVWGHVNMSAAEVKHMGDGLRHLLVPQLSVFAEVDGRVVGCLLGLLDFNPLIKKIDGRLFPFGFLKLWLGRKDLKRLRIMSTNVKQEYQKWGVGVVLNYHLIPAAVGWGIDHGEFSWVLESNHLSRKTLERGGVGLEKIHRIYDYSPS